MREGTFYRTECDNVSLKEFKAITEIANQQQSVLDVSVYFSFICQISAYISLMVNEDKRYTEIFAQVSNLNSVN